MPSAWSHFTGWKWDSRLRCGLLDVAEAMQFLHQALRKQRRRVDLQHLPGVPRACEARMPRQRTWASLPTALLLIHRQGARIHGVVSGKMPPSSIGFAAHGGTNSSMLHFFLVHTLPPLLRVICGIWNPHGWIGEPFPHPRP